MRQRRTIRRETVVPGIGLHTGLRSTITLQPATPGEGLVARFGGSAFQAVDSLRVLATDRCTRVEFDDGSNVDTVEHLFAAIAMAGISDIRITFDSREAPILDGSSLPWLDAIAAAGLLDLAGHADALLVTRPFEFSVRESSYRVVPGKLSLNVGIDFPGSAIGHQTIAVDGADIACLADSRTFVLEHEIEALRAHGLALGGGLHNAVVIGSDGPINPEGFRHPDECVRHKALDLVGDLLLAGCPIIGAFSVHRPGHASNSAFLKAMQSAGVLIRSDILQSRAA
ncbi:UDP-3-O-[3-hydroxymyristoyl] N-acetylglucosamine deacetylase [compost metagenome]